MNAQPPEEVIPQKPPQPKKLETAEGVIGPVEPREDELTGAD